jgi:hypothetical protein
VINQLQCVLLEFLICSPTMGLMSAGNKNFERGFGKRLCESPLNRLRINGISMDRNSEKFRRREGVDGGKSVRWAEVDGLARPREKIVPIKRGEEAAVFSCRTQGNQPLF